MTQSDEAVREGSSLVDEHEPESNAEARAQARASVTPPSSIALDAVTQSARAARQAAVSAVKILDRPGSLGDAQPPSFRQARDWHHQCAGHYEALIMRWPRLLWGYVHLLAVKPALNFAEWVTASPVRFAVAVAVGVIIWLRG